ncbi:MAG: hypothetical protein PHV32_15250, partial [Eubacteriales bacterium]|nr:hypothetical protein [Eubacteriales bacterium]
SINKIIAKQLKRSENSQLYETAPAEERLLPLPPYVCRFLNELKPRYTSPDDYLAYSKTGKQCSAAEYTRELQNINEEHHIASKLDLKILRDTFIVRCIQNKIDIFTIAELTGISSISDFQSRYGELFKTEKEKLCDLESYTTGTRFDRGEPEKLNLLILGAGGYGHTVKEIAEKIGIFDKIAFLDDNTSVPEAIDICKNFKRYKSSFPCAFPAFGDCALRKHWIDILSENGMILPRIIDPAASISPSSVIADAVVIEANATINAQTTIGRGCIISSNALIDRGAVLSEAVHADSSSTTTKDSFVPPLIKIESGTVYNNPAKNKTV